MSKTFRQYEPDQMLLLPVALQEWLPEDHLTCFISDVVDHLDLSPIMGQYKGEERGYPPYHPGMMVKVLYTPTTWVYPPPDASSGASTRTSPSECWPPTTLQTSEPSRTFARTIWKPWVACSSRCCNYVREPDW